jgi:hypothetical protein
VSAESAGATGAAGIVRAPGGWPLLGHFLPVQVTARARSGEGAGPVAA